MQKVVGSNPISRFAGALSAMPDYGHEIEFGYALLSNLVSTCKPGRCDLASRA